MTNFVRNFSKYLFPTVIIGTGIFLSWQNYIPGTWLSGWDTLHPEFDFLLNLKRVFWGVWRSEQGVGAIAAHSHMAELPRIFLLWLSSLFFPLNLLRYLYFFSALILGPLGVYFFINYALEKRKSNWPAFLGSLYYLLNLGTLQIFYVPFEMFAAQFALLPWIFLLCLKYLNLGRRRTLLSLLIISWLASPQAYAATLFYAFFVSLALFAIVYSRLRNIKRGVVVLLTVLIANLYWIFPNIYSVINQSHIIESSQINKLFSEEAFLRNKEYGTFGNIIVHKSFLFSWKEYDFKSLKFVGLMDEWEKWLDSPVRCAGYIFAGIFLCGFALSLIKRDKISVALFPPLLLALFFLLNENLPFGNIYASLRDSFGLFKEGFRTPFTKVSILFIFVTSYYFGYLINMISSIFQEKRKVFGYLYYALCISLLVGLFVYMKPAFEGNLISPPMKILIPNEYFELNEWFKNNPNGRIAKFPIHTKWNWVYHDWGYQGSGISWFGIEQAQFDRDFDRWSEFNEDFYNVMSTAIYSQEVALFEEILVKYDVRYLLLDKSVMNAGGGNEILYIKEFENLIRNSNRVGKQKDFGFLAIYQVEQESNNEIYSPAFLYDAPMRYEDPSNLVRTGDLVSETFEPGHGYKDPHNCELNKEGRVEREYFEGGVKYSAFDNAASCDYFYYPELKYNSGYLMRIKGENISGRGLKLYLFNNELGYLELEELLPQGKFDEYFVIYPKNINGAGYTLNIETRAFGRISSENIIEKIEFTPINTDSVQNIHLGKIRRIDNGIDILEVKKYGPALYKIRVEGDGLVTLSQGHESGWIAFEFSNFQFSIFKHVKVNSWENGWMVPSSIDNYPLTIYVFYWPQALEWAGFILLLIFFVIVLKSSFRSKR